MRSLKVSGIIHLFAVLHAVVALSCHLAGINDELVLTLLTIVLIVLICLKRGLNVEFTAASVIVVNVIGYLLGTGGAQLIELLLHASPVVHAVSTFITTEILGWSIVWFTKLFRRGDDTASRSSAWTPRIGLLLLAGGGGDFRAEAGLCRAFRLALLFHRPPLPHGRLAGFQFRGTDYPAVRQYHLCPAYAQA